MPSSKQIISSIEQQIFFIRGEKVMLDISLATLYGVKTKVLLQAVKRNMGRFPEDFMFQLTVEEMQNLRSQIVTSSWGGRRYLPYVFTEHGVAMLSSVLRSPQAIHQLMAVSEPPKKRPIGFAPWPTQSKTEESEKVPS